MNCKKRLVRNVPFTTNSNKKPNGTKSREALTRSGRSRVEIVPGRFLIIIDNSIF